MATKHYNLPTMPTGAVDWPAIVNDIVAKVEVGRTVKLTAGETLAKGKAFYVKAADGKAYLATYSTGIAGLWQSSSTGAGVEGFGQIGGIMTDSSWTWTPGSYLYIDGSSNLTATDPGTGVRPVAYAISATEVILLESAGHAHDASDVVAGNLAIARMPLGGTWTYTSDVVMQPSSTTLNGLIVRAKTAMGSTTFTGTGLNDATYGGTYSGTVNRTYRVEIDATGTPDTFRWSEDGGSTWKASGVSITGSAQTLSYGVTVTFTNTTGHTVGDYWEVSVTAFSGSLGQWQDAGGTALVEFLSGGGAYFRRDVEGASEIIRCENLAQASTSNTLKIPFRMKGGTGAFTFAELEVKAGNVTIFSEAGGFALKLAGGGALRTALDIAYSSGNFLFGLGMTPTYALDVKGTDFRLDGGAASTTARIRLVDRDFENNATETVIASGKLTGVWTFRDSGDTTTYMKIGTNVAIGTDYSSDVIGTNNLVLKNGTALPGQADTSFLYSKDIAGTAGNASLHFRNEITGDLIVPGIVYKTTAGDPSYSFEGMMVINTVDNTLKMYADGALRTLHTWFDGTYRFEFLGDGDANQNIMRVANLDGTGGMLVTTDNGGHGVIQVTATGGATRLMLAAGADSYLNPVTGNFGVGTTTPLSKVHVAGSMGMKRTAVAADYTTVDEVFIGVTDTSAARTITLASADAVADRVIVVKDESGGAGANNITIATEGTETIDGAASVSITTNYGYVRLYCDGTNWFTW